MSVLTGPGLPLHLLPRLASTRAMRRMDVHAIETLELPGRLLMENAAHRVALRLTACLADMGASGPVVVCCGKGNNGGDGYAAARLLANQGLAVTVVSLGPPGGPDAQANAEAWSRFGPTLEFPDAGPRVDLCLAEAVALVDAVFGTGLTRPVEGAAADLIARMDAAPTPVKVAVDVPSGIDSDTGRVMGVAVRCTHTVSLQAGKPGCHQYPGAAHAGRVEVAPISIPERWEQDEAPTYLLTEAFAAALLPPRPPAGHKGTFGHLLAVCGSAGFGGAALMAGKAALKVGTGLVTLAVPAVLQDRFLAAAPELMTLSPTTGEPLAFEEGQSDAVLEAAAARDAVALGCGLGRRMETAAFVPRVADGIGRPLVIDADGLFHLTPAHLRARRAPTVITPHPGELSRLGGLSREELGADRCGTARRLAAEWGVVLVLKGAGTVIADPGGAVFINPTGDQALASGGTGDVLTGIIGGYLAQGLGALPAALLGVYLHGLARDCQREALTAPYFTATDLIAGINPALHRLGAA
jgi:NAD(P)H-hydrate epimerase